MGLARRKPLKRSGELKRKTALKSTSKLVTRKPLQARTALTAKTRLKTHKRKLTPEQEAAKLLWLAAVLSRSCEVCARRGEVCEGVLQAHHVLYEQHLRGAGLDIEIYNSDNGLCVCEKAHRRHHNRRQPIERSLLRPENIAFAGRVDLMRLIEKFYPLISA